jgi:di/tricarboxylate transporter
MTFETSFVLLAVIIMIVALMKEVARPDMIVFFTLAVFLLTGILSPQEALSGFSNEGMLTIALLFIVSGAVQQAGMLHVWVRKVLGKNSRPRMALFRLMVPVTGISAFMNNTPIVVMFLSTIRNWCKERGLSPSKYLLPLSYAAIFGGMMTLIGTSTNLVIHGLMLDHGLNGLGMFQLTIVGLPAAILGILYMTTVGYRLLPSRKTLEEEMNEKVREYLVEVSVEAHSPIVGKTVEQAGLRNLSGLFLIEIRRHDEVISPVPFYEKIKQGDRLIFTGIVSTIVEIQNMKGLRLETGSELSLDRLLSNDSQLLEAVVSHQSALVNTTIKDSNFRSRFDAAIVAVHRNHARIRGKIGDVILKPGDTLLLLAGKDFYKRTAQSNDFYLISPVAAAKAADPRRAKMAMLALLFMIALAALQIVSMFKAAVIAVLILLLSKCVTPGEAKKYLHFQVLLLIASSFGVGVALQKTGAADWVAGQLITFAEGMGTVGILVMCYLATNILTELITNSAAAVIMFPIVMSAAEQTGMDVMAFMIILAIAASASFVTPIGYQTNLLVYGPGGYRFMDFVRTGLPLSIMYMIITVSIVYLIWA